MVEAKAIAAGPRLPMEAEAGRQVPAIEIKSANKSIRRVSSVALLIASSSLKYRFL